MSLSTLKTAVHDILQTPSGVQSNDDASLLLAFNSARLTAERNYDFKKSRGLGYLTVTASTGALLATAQAGFSSEAPTGSTVLFKDVEMIDLRVNTTGTPVWVPGQYVSEELWKTMRERANRLLPSYSYESPPITESVWNDAWAGTATVYHYGGRLFVSETDNVNVRIYGRQWLTAYASFAAADDFLITYGSDYLMWSAVLWMGFKRGSFVPRNEGSVTLDYVNKMRDEAWESLKMWDAYLDLTPTFLLAQG